MLQQSVELKTLVIIRLCALSSEQDNPRVIRYQDSNYKTHSVPRCASDTEAEVIQSALVFV